MSIVQISTFSPMLNKLQASVPNIGITIPSFLSHISEGWSKLVGLTITYTFLAPYFKRQSVNPPIDAPTSAQVLLLTVIENSFKAASNFNPPLLT